jgi:SAM-dependent methyltransferase
MNYKFAYAIGFHPWEDAERIPKFVGKLGELVAAEENGQQGNGRTAGGESRGRALDLGCGAGVWGIHLAKRGWQVTGVDNAEKALRRARDRIRDEGLDINRDVEVRHGDVTDLHAAGIGAGYRLVLDTGTFHGLNEADRRAMGRQVTAVATDDATVLLLAWNPRWRAGFPRGVSQADIEAAFPGWSVTPQGPTYFPPPKPLRAEEIWYRLRRTS